MSCHGCAETYGFLKREVGCPKCGFSYCKKCLRFQIVDPKTNKQIMVCFKCQQSVQVQVSNEPIVVINALQRLESMDDPAKPPITVYRQPPRKMRLQELKRGLSVEDQHILERLESLKQDNRRPGSSSRTSENIEEEIAERLAKLKDEEYKPASATKPLSMRNTKPETEDELISRFSDEVAMNTKYEAGVVSDIEERLARLRGEPIAQSSTNSTNPQNQPSSSTVGESFTYLPDQEELSEEDQIKLIMQKLEEELALDKKTDSLRQDMDVDQQHSDIPETDQSTISQNSDDDGDISVDELCGICSDTRATLLCEECDGDIFCKPCFLELHRDIGEMHKAKIIQKK